MPPTSTTELSAPTAVTNQQDADPYLTLPRTAPVFPTSVSPRRARPASSPAVGAEVPPPPHLDYMAGEGKVSKHAAKQQASDSFQGDKQWRWEKTYPQQHITYNPYDGRHSKLAYITHRDLRCRDFCPHCLFALRSYRLHRWGFALTLTFAEDMATADRIRLALDFLGRLPGRRVHWLAMWQEHQSGQLHCHLVISGVTGPSLYLTLRQWWPYQANLARCYDSFRWLHYVSTGGVVETHVSPQRRTPSLETREEVASSGGRARAEALTPERRREISRAAAAARWSRRVA